MAQQTARSKLADTKCVHTCFPSRFISSASRGYTLSGRRRGGDRAESKPRYNLSNIFHPFPRISRGILAEWNVSLSTGGLKHGTKQRIPRRKNAACTGSGTTYVRTRTRASCLRYRRIPTPPPPPPVEFADFYARRGKYFAGIGRVTTVEKPGGVSRMIRRETKSSLRGSKRHFSPARIPLYPFLLFILVSSSVYAVGRRERIPIFTIIKSRI